MWLYRILISVFVDVFFTTSPHPIIACPGVSSLTSTVLIVCVYSEPSFHFSSAYNLLALISFILIFFRAQLIGFSFDWLSMPIAVGVCTAD